MSFKRIHKDRVYQTLRDGRGEIGASNAWSTLQKVRQWALYYYNIYNIRPYMMRMSTRMFFVCFESRRVRQYNTRVYECERNSFKRVRSYSRPCISSRYVLFYIVLWNLVRIYVW